MKTNLHELIPAHSNEDPNYRIYEDVLFVPRSGRSAAFPRKLLLETTLKDVRNLHLPYFCGSKR